MQSHPLEKLITPVIENMGYEVVRIMTIGVQNPTLQIMIEPQDHSNPNVDDCAAVSRAVSAVLDEKDPIAGEYTLEVSSPGIDRPLTKPEHFNRFVGYEAKIETSEPIEGRKRFKGKIVSLEKGELVKLNMDGVEYSLPFEVINKAKLILTDDLLAQAAEEQLTD